MPRFFVHRYDVVRVKVAVEADDMVGAMKAADEYLARNHPIPSSVTVPGFSPSDDDAEVAERLGYPTWLHYEEPGQEVVGYLVDCAGDEDYAQSVSFTPTNHPILAPGEEYPTVSADDWRYEVANGDTRLGYEAWACQQLASLADATLQST